MTKTPHTTAQMVIVKALCLLLALAATACSSLEVQHEPGTPSVEAIPPPVYEATPGVLPSPSANPEHVAAPEPAPSAVPPPSPKPQGWTGVHSPYTDFITTWASTWPQQAKDYAAPTTTPLQLRCFTTDDAPFYVGLEQIMVINAPLEAVADTLDDMAVYKDLFPDLDKVEVRGRHKDQILTFWEVHIPIFFVPNVKYEMIYWLRDLTPAAKVYRYQLHERDEIHTSDGAIALLRQGPQTTLYVEYDFTDADWGVVSTLAPGRIWSDTVKGIAVSDLAVKAKSEQPGLAANAARSEAEERIKAYESAIETCIKGRRPFTPTRN